jgi:hypothetical protein
MGDEKLERWLTYTIPSAEEAAAICAENATALSALRAAVGPDIPDSTLERIIEIGADLGLEQESLVRLMALASDAAATDGPELDLEDIARKAAAAHLNAMQMAQSMLLDSLPPHAFNRDWQNLLIQREETVLESQPVAYEPPDPAFINALDGVKDRPELEELTQKILRNHQARVILERHEEIERRMKICREAFLNGGEGDCLIRTDEETWLPAIVLRLHGGYLDINGVEHACADVLDSLDYQSVGNALRWDHRRILVLTQWLNPGQAQAEITVFDGPEGHRGDMVFTAFATAERDDPGTIGVRGYPTDMPRYPGSRDYCEDWREGLSEMARDVIKLARKGVQRGLRALDQMSGMAVRLGMGWLCPGCATPLARAYNTDWVDGMWACPECNARYDWPYIQKLNRPKYPEDSIP